MVVTRSDIPTEESQAKLLRMVQIITLLFHHRRTITELAERFDCSERTIFRYLRTIESCGFVIDKDFSTPPKHFIHQGRCPVCGKEESNG